MNDPIYDRMMTYLRATTLPLYKVAEEAKIAQSTISRIYSGQSKNPRVQTVQALLNYFESHLTVPGVVTGRQGSVPGAALEVGQNNEHQDNGQSSENNFQPGSTTKWHAIRARALGEKAEGNKSKNGALSQ